MTKRVPLTLMLSRVLFAAFILMIILNYASAQDKPIQIPPSPDAGHLGTYGEFQVTKTTGSADVSIPLINLQEGGITIPINLSYQSSGLRPADRPSWVGMGWVLSAGGVISRTMRGAGWDDMSNGFLRNLTNIPPEQKVRNSLALTASDIADDTYLELRRIVDDQYGDYEPDAFSFNFGNHGGSFFFGNDGNVHCVEHSALKFEPVRGSVAGVATLNVIKGWIVTDEKGLVYTFDTCELTDTRAGSNITPAYVSSWYLTSIYNPTTLTTATFTYSSTPYSATFEDKSHTYTYSRELPNPNYDPGILTTTTLETTHEKVKFLSMIKLNDHAIEFFTSSTPEPWKRLDEVRWNRRGSQKKFLFNYDYFGTPCSPVQLTGCQRSKLLSLTEYHATDPVVYSFEYYPGTVPSTRTFAQDHWGFFNGETGNTNLVPDIVYASNLYYGGADRTPSFSHTLIGMLKKITYPTKGSTTFTYEQNTWEDETVVEDVEIRQNITSLQADGSSNSVPDCASVTINATDTDYEYDLKYTYKPEFDHVNPPMPQHYPYVKIFEVGNSTPIRHHIMNYTNPAAPTNAILSLPAGESYRIEACAYQGETAKVNGIQLIKVNAEDVGQPIARPTGGLRLSKLENYDDESGDTYTRTFDYGMGGYRTNPSLPSDGVPIYSSQSYSYYEVIENGSLVDVIETYYLRISSSPTIGLSSSTVPVAYEKVTEWLGTPALNTGRIETTFRKQQDQATGMVPQISRHTSRTKVKMQKEFDSQGNLVKEDEYGYNELLVGTVQGFRVKRARTSTPFDYVNDFTVANYNLYASWHQVSSKKSSLLTPQGTITQITTYEYDPTLTHTNVVSETTVNSAGDEIKKQYTYPTDKTFCVEPCYETYHEALQSCNGLTNIFAMEAQGCQDIWDMHMGELYECIESTGSSFYCYRQFQLNVEAGDYFPCLEGLGDNYEFEDCQKRAFIAYKVCQSDFRGCVEEELSEATLFSEKALAKLILDNQYSVPVEIKTFNNETQLNKISYQFNLWNDNVPLQETVTITHGAGPAIPQFTVTHYDPRGNPAQLMYHKEGFSKAYLWGYDSSLLIAEFSNATLADVGHSSFENYGNEGNLSFQNAFTNDAKTGSSSHALNNRSITKYALTASKRYRISYWAKSGVPSVSNTTIVSGFDLPAGTDGWKYYEKIVTGSTSLTISGTGSTLIDELRIGPEDALVTTFVHQPGVGIVSTTDTNNRIAYYSYDALGRLKTVEDHYHNLLRLLKYNYKD